MKSKPYLKKLARPVLKLNLLLICLLIYGCSIEEIKPTYKQADIPLHIEQICLEEYNLEVSAFVEGQTVWVYAPLEKLMHKDFSSDPKKIFDEKIAEKLRNILSTIGRVLVSADRAPEFYCLVASDINEIGVDYVLIGYILDIKKSYAHFIPWTEANRRYVFNLRLNPRALGDTSGKHLAPFDIELSDFLAAQVAQRVSTELQQEELKEYLKIERLEGTFDQDTFTFEYAVKELKEPDQKIDIKEMLLETVSYVTQTYEFKDFQYVEITNLLKDDTYNVTRPFLKEIK